ncbi:MAG: T9SS type A sorting domain-containing protein [Candidatus Hatepunaea meridiana]|nr:T9SS type A sorting domain-containing protein [Candidatus Hatepunaea meridiana]
MKRINPKIISVVIIAILLICTLNPMTLNANFCIPSKRFYNPADSTIYFAIDGVRWWEDDSKFIYIFRLKDEAHSIERTSDLVAQDSFWIEWPEIHMNHDNIEGRLYSGRVDHWIVSEDGGNNWSEAEGPQNVTLSMARENPGESFRKGRILVEERIRSELYSSSDSWESWDTSNVADNWNTFDNLVFFTKRNGCLIRFPHSLDRLEFSSDTGRTWIDGDLGGELVPRASPRHTWAGVGDEFYRGFQGMIFWCISDSGREIREVFDFRDHGPYDYVNDGGFQWNEGYLVTTPNPGEFYAIIDSTSWDSWGIKMDIYHCWDYGERIEMLRYNMPDFEPRDPESVKPDIAPIPVTTLLNIFPNPTNDGVTVHLDRGIRNGSLWFYDVSGRFIGKAYLPPSAGQTIFQLNLQSILKAPEPSGIYLMVLNADGTIYNRTITVVR